MRLAGRTPVAMATRSKPLPHSEPAWLGDLIIDDLERVETRIQEALASRETRLSEIADYLINAGGKRIRPAVSLLVFRACGGTDISDMVDLSVALELIHTATLLHDDIIDSNDVRRGQDAALLKYGIADTLVTGDFLFCRAFEVCGRFEPKIVAWAANACVQLTEGEMLQGRFRSNPQVDENTYFEIVGRKTASLFAAGTQIASYLAGVDDLMVRRMRSCGHDIGVAFQMIDDVLDIEGDPSNIGKQVGTDLLDGNPSLPIVRSLDVPEVREAFLAEHCTVSLGQRARRAIVDAGILDTIRDEALVHARTAAEVVKDLPGGEFREALEKLIAGLVDRDL